MPKWRDQKLPRSFIRKGLFWLMVPERAHNVREIMVQRHPLHPHKKQREKRKQDEVPREALPPKGPTTSPNRTTDWRPSGHVQTHEANHHKEI